VRSTLKPPVGFGSRPVGSPPTPRHETQIPGGPRRFAKAFKGILISGPGEPPPGFINGNNSASEWMIFWACLKLFGPQGEKWSYQSKVAGGRTRPGGAVPDFVLLESNTVMRVQTERYHIAVKSYVQLKDQAQLIMLERLGYKVIDIFEEHFIQDKSGQSAIKLVHEASQGVQRASPLASRTSRARG